MPLARFLVSPFEEAEKLAQTAGRWIVATVDPQIFWPKRKQTIDYDNKTFLLLPRTESSSPAVALRADAYLLEPNDARKAIMRFCTALSWSERGGLEIVAMTGGNLPRPVNVLSGRGTTEIIEPDSMPVLTDEVHRCALALYREGVSLRNPFYAFLSLYKVISAALPVGRQRARWIETALGDLDDRQAVERRDELLAAGTNVSEYVWDEGRNAIAHAELDPHVNPDDTEDHFRLQQDLPLIRNLAELAIEKVLGVPRPHTLWKEHKYELGGFRRIFPDQYLELMKRAEPLPEGATVEMPDSFTVVARRGAEIIAFENLRPQFTGQAPEGLVLDLISDHDSVVFRVLLDFAHERCSFEPTGGIGFKQDRSTRVGLTNEIRVLRFQRCVLSNGHIEIWDPATETLYGRSETYIPLNVMVNHEFFAQTIAELEALLLRRAQVEAEHAPQ